MAAGEVARSSPRVFGLMVVRDAVDLVRVNALHHFEAGLERLLVIDNGSRDGTGELLRELALELPLEVESDPGPFRQADLTNRLAFEARHAGADWVLPIDADEFFVAEAGLPAVVGGSDAGALAIEMVNFVQRHGVREPSPRGLLTMDHRARHTLPQGEARYHVESGEWSIVEVAWHRKLIVRLSEATWIGTGAHTLRRPAGRIEPTAEIVCLHAPLRARSAIADRVVHARRIAAAGAAPDTGWQNRDLDRGEQEVERLWRANSNRDGRLVVGGERRGLVGDRRLRDLVSAHLSRPLTRPRQDPSPPVDDREPPSEAPPALPPGFAARMEESRAAILDAVGPSGDVTFVRGAGNLGDQLIWSGARRVLEGVAGREISYEDLGGSSGEVAVLTGGGALCRPFHELMPHAIAVAGLRYERVVVLPSSVDVGEDVVRTALERTEAIVFARELETMRAIESLCDARLGLDTAFFHDYGRFVAYAGSGTLNAFRADAEARGHAAPPGSEDISATAGSLDEWLHAIASAARVRTDRAHVMIAAAMLGKPVEYAGSSYHKLPAIAEWSLDAFGVTPIEPARPVTPAARPLPRRSRPGLGSCAVIVTRDRPERAAGAVASVLADPRAEAVVVDANSAPLNRERLAEATGERAELLQLQRNDGLGASLAAGVERAGADRVLLLDQLVELDPGALERLGRELDDHPETAAVAATVLAPAGGVEQSGGSIERDGELVALRPIAARALPTSDALPTSGACDWAPWSALLVRAEALAELPPAAGLDRMADREWALRARGRGLAIRRSAEAVARAIERPRPEHAVAFAERMRRLELACEIAAVRERHAVVLADLFETMPELERSLDRGRELLSLLLDQGPHRVLADWDGGRLGSVLGDG